MIDVAYCVFRAWSLRLLGLLLDAQAGAPWRITRVFTPRPGHGLFDSLFDHAWYSETQWVRRLGKARVNLVHPQNLADANVLTAPRPSVVLCYGWSWRIPEELYTQVPCLICHPSPLPRYRGGSPIQNQLLAGETISAVSILEAGPALDAGPLLAQRSISFEGSLQDILDRMTDVGANLTLDLLGRYARGRVSGVVQDESLATTCRRRRPEESEITPEEIRTKPAEYLYNKVRGLQDPYPNAFIRCADGRRLSIVAVRMEPPSG
jgi:methionyl-tRNA formyltransferase